MDGANLRVLGPSPVRRSGTAASQEASHQRRSRLAGAEKPGRLIPVAIAGTLAVHSLREVWRRAPSLHHGASFLFPKSYLDRASRAKRATPGTESVVRDLKVIAFFATAGYVVCFSRQQLIGAPYVPQISRRQLPSPSVGALLAAGLYGANVAYNVLNKRVLIAYPCPLLVTTMNLLTCSLCCVVAWAAGISRPPPRLTRDCLRIVPLMAFHWAGILLANVSVSEVNIAFTHTVKSAEPVFTALFATAMLGTSVSPRAWLYLTLVCAGVALASTTELSFTWLGFWAAMASNVTVSLRTVLSKRLIDSKMVQDPLSFIMVLHCGAFVISLAVALLLQGSAFLAAPPTPLLAGLAVGPLVWVFNAASILVLSWTSPVAHSMIRALRRPILVLASIVAFGTALRPLNVGGVIAALAG
eukprot:CAMPEP_0204599194 /NCGR_PEP_ID=MMETSP0661-20131031/54697_1 /ASSEMBLY_ACC=CAM_ASM_000606 /TAXON_ID=109239 /ORGANISM="Alexandrium margalefi, Strain AMGDE01CS-322" /LENGTH=413 /DNA_ID=CAMNT_0051609909 /DNA_START=32 /DNA_END=1269 /DNA_ORIENTATION=-